MTRALVLFLLLTSFTCAQEHAKRTTLNKDSISREIVLKELRARIVPDSTKRAKVSAEGEMYAFRNWVFYRGVQNESRDVLSSNRTAGLFLKTGDDQWVAVEATKEFTDEMLPKWLAKYALTRDLFGR